MVRLGVHTDRMSLQEIPFFGPGEGVGHLQPNLTTYSKESKRGWEGSSDYKSRLNPRLREREKNLS